MSYKTKKPFVLLGMIEKFQISNIYLLHWKVGFRGGPKIRVNQIKTDALYHFNTTGTIYSFVLCPKYCTILFEYWNKTKTHSVWFLLHCHLRTTSNYKETTIHGEYNMAVFYFNVIEHMTFLIPLDVSTIVVYSGFLLTHR